MDNKKRKRLFLILIIPILIVSSIPSYCSYRKSHNSIPIVKECFSNLTEIHMHISFINRGSTNISVQDDVFFSKVNEIMYNGIYDSLPKRLFDVMIDTTFSSKNEKIYGNIYFDFSTNIIWLEVRLKPTGHFDIIKFTDKEGYFENFVNEIYHID